MLKGIFYFSIISAFLLSIPVKGWSDDGTVAITIPSADVTLSFIQPGRIAKVCVKEGDIVKVNQILIQQDDDAEKAQLLLLKEQSEDRTQIEAQKAILSQKKDFLERLEWMVKQGSVTEVEVQDARLEAKIADFNLKKAEFEHEQNKRKYAEARIRVDNMRLKSPIRGRIEKVEVEVGESIDSLSDAIKAVRTDPLWIDVHLPIEKGRNLKLGQTTSIIFPGIEKNVSKGKIIFISSVADAASSTLRARIEVPNKSNRPAGEHVTVLF